MNESSIKRSMAKLSNSELEVVLNAERETYRPEAIEIAEAEMEARLTAGVYSESQDEGVDDWYDERRPTMDWTRFQPPNLVALYFSPRGRVRRLTYVFAKLPIVVGLVLAFGVDPSLGVAVSILVAWPSMALGAKRLQDFGAPGIPVVIGIGVGELFIVPGIDEAWLANVFAFFVGLVGLFALFTKGEPGANQYGPDPRS